MIYTEQYRRALKIEEAERLRLQAQVEEALHEWTNAAILRNRADKLEREANECRAKS